MIAQWRTLLALGAVLLISRLWVSTVLGLGDAEALYYCYSRHLQLSYLDHPPLIGWSIRLFTELIGTSVLAVRLTPILSTAVTLAISFLLTRDLFGERAASWSVVLMFSLPVFSVGLTAAAPDAPLAALWMAATWQLYRAAADRGVGRWQSWGRPLVIGGLIGLAFLSKYTGFCLVLSVIWAVLSPGGRDWLRRPGFWMGAGLALVLALPVIWWNQQHQWAGVLHRLVWTQGGAGFGGRNIGALIGGQLLYLGPFMAALVVWAALWLRRQTDSPPGSMMLLAVALPALGLTFVLCLWSDVAEPHWPAVGYLPLVCLAAGQFCESTSGRWLKRLNRLAVGWGGLLFFVLHVLVLTPLLPAMGPDGGYQPQYDLGNELRGWPELARVIRRDNNPERPVLAAFYTQCSQLSFALSAPNDPPVYCVSPERDDFDFWFGPLGDLPAGALFVTDNRFDHHPLDFLPGAQLDGPPKMFEIRRAGRWARRFLLYELEPMQQLEAGKN